MTELFTLPISLITRLQDHSVADLKRSTAAAQQRWVHADLSKCRSLTSVLHRLADAFHLPDYFGENLDALYDCLADQAPPTAPMPGFVVVLEGLLTHIPQAQREALLAVFDAVAQEFAQHGIAYRVFYTLAEQD